MASPSDLLQAARALRGTAHLAGEDGLVRVALTLEQAVRALVHGDLSWSTDIRERVERTIGDVDVLIAGNEADEALRNRIDAATERWSSLGIGGHDRPVARQKDEGGLDDEAFLSFAAREIDGIVTVLGDSVDALSEDPQEREPLRRVLRSQRALLGIARLDDLPAVSETLHAIEDVSGIIAKMGVGIKDEWLDVFRCARSVLEASAGSLARGEDPPHTPALSRLRTYRQELLERYGAGEETTAILDASTHAAAETPEIDDAAAAEAAANGVEAEPAIAGDPAGTSAGADTLDIQNLVYAGESALRRALGLRARLERAVEHDPDALAIVDEVFDLIRLGLE
jgi:chemotaxis protein histidine kinase CheA